MINKQNWLNAIDCRRLLKINEDIYPINLFDACNNLDNLTLIRCDLGDNISGMCIKKNDNTYIAINSSMSKGRQNFTLAHELYHMLYDTNEESIICTNDLENSYVEKNANEFARFLLLSVRTFLKSWKELLNLELLERVINMEQRYQVSHEAMVYYLKDFGLISNDEANKLTSLTNIKSIAKKYGFDDSLYSPTNKCTVSNNHINLINKTYDEDLISNGKREEMLIEAFRSDLVYGI